MRPPVIFLWAHPRSVSTALERVFIERGDFNVFHEPFSQAFFFGEERTHPRFADQAVKPDCTFRGIWDEIEQTGRRNGKWSFVKDLAFHMQTPLRSALLAQVHSTFLIRDPRKAFTSMYKRLPDFDWTEAGYEALYRVFQEALRIQKNGVLVIDADHLRQDPEAVLRAYCTGIGVLFLPKSLRWEPKVIPSWEAWKGWHDDAQFSRGLMSETATDVVTLPDRVQEMIERALPIYRAMKVFAEAAASGIVTSNSDDNSSSDGWLP